MNSDLYFIERTCGKCKHKERIDLTKEEAAFDLYDSNKASTDPCIKCNSAKNIQISIVTPNLDEDLLDTWGQNLEYQFWEQDEDLMLATTEETQLFLNAIDSKKYLDEKIVTLLNTLLVILYDAKENELLELESKLLQELKARKELLEQKRAELYEYVVEKTFPIIGIA